MSEYVIDARRLERIKQGQANLNRAIKSLRDDLNQAFGVIEQEVAESHKKFERYFILSSNEGDLKFEYHSSGAWVFRFQSGRMVWANDMWGEETLILECERILPEVLTELCRRYPRLSDFYRCLEGLAPEG